MQGAMLLKPPVLSQGHVVHWIRLEIECNSLVKRMPGRNSGSAPMQHSYSTFPLDNDQY